METADDGRQREIIGETSDRRTCEVPTRLENDKIAATLSDRGAILQIENKLSGQGHDVRSDWFFVRTDGGDFDSRRLAPAGEVAGDLSASFVFQSAAGQVALEYRLRPDAAYVERIRGVDLLIHECYLPDRQAEFARKTGHSHTTPVAELARRAGVRRLVLVHLNPTATADDPIGLDVARAIFPETTLGEDRMEVEF
jgi:hypothetical protein